MRFASVVAVLWALPWVGAAARADDGSDAAALRERGLAAFDEGRYEVAARAFTQAVRLRPAWKLYYNIGQSWAAAKRYGLALDAFERYLAEGGDEVEAERRDEVLVEAERLRKMVGSLEVRAPDGVEVFVEGESRGATPLAAPIRVTAGLEQEARLVRGGAAILVKRFVVGVGQTAVVEATEAKGFAAAPPPAPATAAPAKREDRSGKIGPTAFWVGLGAAVALGGGTLALYFVTDARVEDLRADPGDGALRDETETLQITGIAFLAATAAAAVTTGVLAGFTDFRGKDDEAAVSMAPWAVSGSAGLAVAGRF